MEPPTGIVLVKRKSARVTMAVALDATTDSVHACELRPAVPALVVVQIMVKATPERACVGACTPTTARSGSGGSERVSARLERLFVSRDSATVLSSSAETMR